MPVQIVRAKKKKSKCLKKRLEIVNTHMLSLETRFLIILTSKTHIYIHIQYMYLFIIFKLNFIKGINCYNKIKNKIMYHFLAL